MGTYLLKRIGQTLIVLVVVSFGAYLLMDLLPGDQVYAMYGDEISPEQYDLYFHELQLDKPLPVRYFNWLVAALHGDFGISSVYRQPVTDMIGNRLPVTLYLAIMSMLISTPIGIFFGIVTAVKKGKWQDTTLTLIANAAVCLPTFWMAILLLYIFCMKLGWLPSFGFTWPWVDLGMSFRQCLIPVFCMSLYSISSYTRMTRSSMLDVIRQDYIMTARSKGLTENKITLVHAMKNGLIPVVSVFGVELAHLVGGSIFVESVFGIQGMGSLLVKAITARDMPVVQACILLSALVSCVAYIITDVLYAVVDPRMQYTSVVRRQISRDGGRTWSSADVLFPEEGTFCRQPIQILSNGRWIFSNWICTDSEEGLLGDPTAFRISDDQGRGWKMVKMPESSGRVHANVVELENGHLAAFIKTFELFMFPPMFPFVRHVIG